MLKSMTGFGQADGGGWFVEIKGINHRYRDIHIRLPRNFGPLEILVSEMAASVINRGRVDIFITKRDDINIESISDINWETAQHYYERLTTMANRFGGEVCFRDIMWIPGVLAPENQDLNKVWSLLKGIVEEAIKIFIDSKQAEGERLKKDIFQRLNILSDILTEMKAISRDMPELCSKRLSSNIHILLEDSTIPVDDVRVAQEVALISEKCDITEELVRLESHLDIFRGVINGRESPVGRRLDFILQEINREVNTIGSKSQIAALSHLVIDAKAEVEKIREQVANIE
ncbi:MAG: YicC family protein [Deltaproteobacteria bacterium]|nr:YicC family protein [Deltaproteobacteria bacterium]